jgi:hypothetical protein
MTSVVQRAAPVEDAKPEPTVGGAEITEGAKARRYSAHLAILAFIAIPTIFFVGADLIGGHLLLYTDNLLQSYPLRVLVGNDLRHGVFPAWDPYIWSGTPLMAGLNAGAFYPTTLLFAILPSHAAWVFGEIFVYAATGIGAFLLFRSGGASDGASFLGAFSFTFAGAVATQASVHLDMAEGLVSLPWAVLAVRRISEDGKWRWAVVFAVASAFAILAGSPEAMLALAITSVTYAVARWTIDRNSWRNLVTRLVPAGVVALGATSFLSIPALDFIATSNRGHVSLVQAAANYLDPRSAVLAVVPYLEGGFHLFTQLSYFGPDNPSELGFYIGILPVIAAFALIAPSWGRWLPRGERRCWYAVIVVGIITSVAAGTVLEQLLYHVPLYGSQHDSGRFVVEIDLGACALLTWWIDGGSRPRRAAEPYWWASPVVPAAVVLAVAAWFVVAPASLWSALGSQISPPARPSGTVQALVMAGALVLVGGAIVAGRSRLERRQWIAAVAAFIVVDLALFAGGSLYIGGQNPPDVSQPGSVLALIKANLTPGGRYAIFDPDSYDLRDLPAAGEADAALPSSIASVSGYESIGDAVYAKATGTKVRADMREGFLFPAQYIPVGLQVLVTVPEAFLVPVLAGSNPPMPITEAPGTDPLLPEGNEIGPGLPAHPISADRLPMTAGSTYTWWFGERAAVSKAVLLFQQPSAGQLVEVGTVGRDRAIKWGTTHRLPGNAATATFSLPATTGYGLAVRLVSGADLGPLQAAIMTGSSEHLLAGAFSDVVTARNWRVIGQVGNFVLFRAMYTPQQAWLESPTGSAPGALPPSGSVGVESTSPNGASLAVRALAPELVVWSMAYNAGWRAQLVPAAGVTPAGSAAVVTALPVQREGLVMGVQVPKGLYTIVFSYHPPGLSTGLDLALATLLVVGVGVIAGLVVSRRRRSSISAGHQVR